MPPTPPMPPQPLGQTRLVRHSLSGAASTSSNWYVVVPASSSLAYCRLVVAAFVVVLCKLCVLKTLICHFDQLLILPHNKSTTPLTTSTQNLKVEAKLLPASPAAAAPAAPASGGEGGSTLAASTKAAEIAGSVGSDVGDEAAVWRRAFVEKGALSSLLKLFEGQASRS